MAETYTSNLGLTKPDYDSPADISVINSNMDKIDSAVANAGKVKSVNGKTGDVTLAAADVGALPSGGTAKDSNKLGGKAPEYYLQPRNLLDNSNFKDFIAQAGLNGLHGTQSYLGDRWISSGIIVSASDKNGIALTSEGQFGNITQRVAVTVGRVYTLAVKGQGEDFWGIVSNSAGATISSAARFVDGLAVCLFTAEENIANINLYIGFVDGGGTATLEWAALYEGEYTAETLPPYVPKGYTAELIECMRYAYIPLNSQFAIPVSLGGYSSVTFPIKMRKAPTVNVDSLNGVQVVIVEQNEYGVSFRNDDQRTSQFTIKAFADL